MLIKNQAHSALSYRPGCISVMLVPARVFIHWVQLVGVFGLRGTLLEKENCQDDVSSHLQELALPILKNRFQIVTTDEISPQGQRGSAVGFLIFVVFVKTCHGLTKEKNEKQSKHHQRETVVAEEYLHSISRGSPPLTFSCRVSFSFSPDLFLSDDLGSGAFHDGEEFLLFFIGNMVCRARL